MDAAASRDYVSRCPTPGIYATPGLGFDSCCLHAGAEHPRTSTRDTTAWMVDRLADHHTTEAVSSTLRNNV